MSLPPIVHRDSEQAYGELLERGGAAQPIRHVRERLAFGEVAREARVVSAPPSPYPLTEQRAFLELEASLCGGGTNAHALEHRARL